MKKSNKLLLGGFLTVLLLISAIHISLYAKYKRGEYTAYNAADDMQPPSMQLYPNILFVSVRNVPAATVRLGDAAEVEKGERTDLQITRRGDSLLIAGRDGAATNNHAPLVLHLPGNATVAVYNSDLSITADRTTTEKNPVLTLERSTVSFLGDRSPVQLGQVTITAIDSSAVRFQGRTGVDNLAVQLSKSSLEYTEGEVGQLSIATDSLSRLNLQSKHLLRANISNKQ